MWNVYLGVINIFESYCYYLMSFEKGEVVWAKIKGYPWWPAVVGLNAETKFDSSKILVNFIGENSQ